ncbi:cupin domain-containing protein [Herbiconiux sp. CPCC 203407]|uniref:Cupin domain-containing protein n=1 Tax=Herbiconiux oxytropis TaxID=2970915 RepID=A0AA41XHR1_9MICO|nr:cupin domain-containing protein [Herbiconiux oxytropis]MCS5722540.1 cupin domain-containing protein [Herbiconiux oxytropis]MCS5726480.1 cupin domain-containing protein [Herbiconiux oxytropis]
MTEVRDEFALPANAAVAALEGDLEHEAVAPDDVVAGAPTTATAELVAEGDRRIGLWEITPGVVTDTEADEVFVVLAGRGRVEFLSPVDGGEAGEIGAGELPESLELVPGTVGRLAAGTRTRWTITETLRKVYIL